MYKFPEYNNNNITAEELRKISAAARDKLMQVCLRHAIPLMTDAANRGERSITVSLKEIERFEYIEWLINKDFIISLIETDGTRWSSINSMRDEDVNNIWFNKDVKYCEIRW